MSENEKYTKELEELRKDINKIDDQIIDLLNKRGDIALKIGNNKKLLDLDTYQPLREKEVIDRIKSKARILKQENIEEIWKEIMGSCKVIQGSVLKVGYLGPQGTFTHQAALDFFPRSGTEFIPCKNTSEIFENIEKDILEFGVIAIENSLHGTVHENLDHLIDADIIIFGELELRIIQNLITQKGTALTDIENLYSHPQGFAQTQSWIKANLPSAKLINMESTAEAVHLVKELNNKKNAAIGSEFASKSYNLQILSSNIEDNPINFTRFLIISKKENELREGKNVKTSLVYVTKHVPGALYKVLKIFAEADINLTKIESRPRRRSENRWEYIFLMDFEGDKEDLKIKEVLEKMSDLVIFYKILGSYPIT